MMNNSITTVSFRVYRHIAYRRFVLWIWHRLGRGNRKIIPACVVTKIRSVFPSEQYTGFQYPRPTCTNCRANLLRRVATSWSLLYGSHFEVNDGGWYPRSLSASWPAVWYEGNCLLRSTRLMRKMSMYSTIT